MFFACLNNSKVRTLDYHLCEFVQEWNGAEMLNFLLWQTDKSILLPSSSSTGFESLYLGTYCPYEILLSELHQLLQHHFCIVQEIIGKAIMRGFLVWSRPEAGFIKFDDFRFGVGHEYRGMGWYYELWILIYKSFHQSKQVRLYIRF